MAVGKNKKHIPPKMAEQEQAEEQITIVLPIING